MKKAQTQIRNYLNNGILEPNQLSFYDFQFQEEHKQHQKRLIRHDAIEDIPKLNLFDFIQCEAGDDHCLLLNSLGQVFSFGEGSKGQLGYKQYQNNIINQINFAQIKENENNEQIELEIRNLKITRIKANSFDSAAFDDKHKRVFTWGSFGAMKMADNSGKKLAQFRPKLLELSVFQKKGNEFSGGINKLYDASQTTIYAFPGKKNQIEKSSILKGQHIHKHLDKLTYIQSIDWGHRHCTFVDQKNRIFTFGLSNMGYFEPFLNNEEEQEISSASDEEFWLKEKEALNERNEKIRVKTVDFLVNEYNPKDINSKKKLLQINNQADYMEITPRLDPISAKLKKQLDMEQSKKNKFIHKISSMSNSKVDFQQEQKIQKTNEDHINPIPRMVTQFCDNSESISEIQCGDFHTLFFTQTGQVYSWGESNLGQLGIGFSAQTLSPKQPLLPKKIVKKKKDDSDDQSWVQNDPIKSASCGQSINFVVTIGGIFYKWGQPSYIPSSPENLKPLCRPNKVLNNYNVKIKFAYMGSDHGMLIDEGGQLWGIGSNQRGQLGTGDSKNRKKLQIIRFFSNQRVIDVACGKDFTVIITEVFDVQSNQQTQKLSSKAQITNPRQSIFSYEKMFQGKETSQIQSQIGKEKINDNLSRNSQNISINQLISNQEKQNDSIQQTSIQIIEENDDVYSDYIPKQKNQYILSNIKKTEKQYKSLKNLTNQSSTDEIKTLQPSESQNFDIENKPYMSQAPYLSPNKPSLQKKQEFMIGGRHLAARKSNISVIKQARQQSSLNLNNKLRHQTKSLQLLQKEEPDLNYLSQVSKRSELSEIKSRFMNALNEDQSSHMNPQIKDLVRQSMKKKLKNPITEEQNELLNPNIIKVFLNSAFGISDMKEKAIMFKKQNNNNLEKEMVEVLDHQIQKLIQKKFLEQRKKQLKGKATENVDYTQELEQLKGDIIQKYQERIKINERFGASLFEDSDPEDQPTSRRWQNDPKEIYEQILSKDYKKYFEPGFKLSHLDEQYAQLSKQDKAQLLGNVLGSLDKNLKIWSSPQKQIKYIALQKNQKLLVNELASHRYSVGQKHGNHEETNIKLKEMQKLHISKKYHKRDFSEMAHNKFNDEIFKRDDYNPYVSAAKEGRLKHISQSASLLHKDQPVPELFVGREYLRRVSRIDAKMIIQPY